MKNSILKTVVTCLIVSNIQTVSIDFLNSLIISPRLGAIVTTRNPVIIGIVRNINQKPVKNKPVTVYLDRCKAAVVPTNKHGVWSYALNNAQLLNDGFHSVQACVTLSPHNVVWTQGTLFYVQGACTPEAYRSGNVNSNNSAINFPFEDSYINTTMPIVVGSLLDSSLDPVSGETVNVKIDTITVGNPVSDSNGVFSYEISTGLSEAAHTVGAHCVQSSVDLTTNNFTVDVTAPAAPTIVTPSENATVTSNPVVVIGTSESFATIMTFMDGDTYGDISYADESGNWSIEYTLANGAHSVTAQASDLANNTGSLSAARNFTVNT